MNTDVIYVIALKETIVSRVKGFMGEGKNFFSREKRFFPSPKPSPFFKKSVVVLLQFVAKNDKVFCGKNNETHI